MKENSERIRSSDLLSKFAEVNKEREPWQFYKCHPFYKIPKIIDQRALWKDSNAKDPKKGGDIGL